MNKEVILLRNIIENDRITQRELAKAAGISLGTVNKLIRKFLEEGLIEYSGESGQVKTYAEKTRSVGKTEPGLRYTVTRKGYEFLKPYKVDCAVIMAAGFGSRFVPLTFETPKGLLEVFGEPMMERQIKQLISAGISDIAVIVGYLKEKFDYLTDKYGCKLIYNPEFESKNNISSIHAARDYLRGRNAYILSSDHWIRENIFHAYEGAAWYASRHFSGETSEWVLLTDKKGRITDTYAGGRDCECMYGPAYFSREFSEHFLPVLEKEYSMPGTSDYYWEDVFKDMLNGTAKKRLNAFYGHVPEIGLCDGIEMYVNPQPEDNVYEFENLEELREFDPKYMEDSGSEAMRLVSRVFDVPEFEISRIRRLKAGMTNNSWLFSVKGNSYICRIPGQGTEKLINRKEEKASFEAVKDLNITEKVIYYNENDGYKISEFYEDSRNADPHNETDMQYCMQKLKMLHGSGVSVTHHFDIGKKISFYEELCGGEQEIPFSDYPEIKKQKDELLSWLSAHKRQEVLSHIDPVADNFIFLKGADISDTERDIDKIRLIDWEYAAMCDPMIDIAMCAIYSYMQEDGAMMLMCGYFGREPDVEEKALVYAYMALGGLLWALWGVYKEKLGLNFTDYTIKMYRYFKKYSVKAMSF